MNTSNFTYNQVGGLKFPFELGANITFLPAYRKTPRMAKTLAPLYEFLEDGNYIMSVRAVPSTQQQNYSNDVPANQMFEDQISVPKGSFLIMIGAVSSQGLNTFRVKLFDVGAQSYLSDDFVNAGNLGGQINQTPTTGQPFVDATKLGLQANSYGMFILPSPIAISSPGQLGVQIVNLANATATIDMAFYFACPIHDKQQVGPAVIGSPMSKRNWTSGKVVVAK